MMNGDYSIVSTADGKGVAIKRLRNVKRGDAYEVCVDVTDDKITVMVFKDIGGENPIASTTVHLEEVE
jgi:hypothetical protein